MKTAEEIRSSEEWQDLAKFVGDLFYRTAKEFPKLKKRILAMYTTKTPIARNITLSYDDHKKSYKIDEDSAGGVMLYFIIPQTHIDFFIDGKYLKETGLSREEYILASSDYPIVKDLEEGMTKRSISIAKEPMGPMVILRYQVMAQDDPNYSDFLYFLKKSDEQLKGFLEFKNTDLE